MPPEPTVPTVDDPLTDLSDQRVLQILSTEHWSLLSARSLAYNEAFTRGGMFLTFLSMSFVALALFSSAMSFGADFLVVAAVVLGFDFVIGILTYGRILGANVDDLRAVHGMARIRHSYTQIAPIVEPYFTTGTHDDMAGAMLSYGGSSTGGAMEDFLYGLTTSGGMIGLITCMVGGVFGAVAALLIGLGGGLAVAVAVLTAMLLFAALSVATFRAVPRAQAELKTLFPTPEADAASEKG